MVQAAKKEQQFLKESGRNVKKYASITQQSYVAVCHGGGSQRPAESSHAVLRKNGNPPLKTPQLFLQLQLETLKATGIQKVRKYVSVSQQSFIDFVPSDLQVEATGQSKNHVQLLRNNGSTADNTCALVLGGNGTGVGKWEKTFLEDKIMPQCKCLLLLVDYTKQFENYEEKSATGLAKVMRRNWEKRALNITKRLHFVKKEVAKGNTKIRNGSLREIKGADVLLRKQRKCGESWVTHLRKMTLHSTEPSIVVKKLSGPFSVSPRKPHLLVTERGRSPYIKTSQIAIALSRIVGYSLDEFLLISSKITFIFSGATLLTLLYTFYFFRLCTVVVLPYAVFLLQLYTLPSLLGCASTKNSTDSFYGGVVRKYTAARQRKASKFFAENNRSGSTACYRSGLKKHGSCQKNRLPLSQCANCCVCGGKRTAIDRRKKTRMISRGALVIGICEHIRALCLKKGFVKRYVNVALSAAILFVIFERERGRVE
ncbi:hypothetical protein T4C_3253 [Trichinella pseudospiralis]|uniref:Uncharacterized protein n=1 Tax=Trichinella pseudospiralis TaxID=6337 RepID=A0A0V1IS46_TRIPS|nr:hypothetical protein T4C_3253 [Trichinella pseudospiralis]